jgi:hypothetical protein
MKLPHLTFYVDSLPRNAAGVANGPIIRIRKDKRDDEGLWLHEYEHVRQWYVTLFTHGIWYLTVRRYRAWAEARAYAAQVRPDRSDLDVMARRMAGPLYNLKMTVDECREAITRYLGHGR